MVIRVEMPNPPTQLVALYILQFCHHLLRHNLCYCFICPGMWWFCISVFLNFHLSVLIESLECCSPMWDLAGKDILSKVSAWRFSHAFVLTLRCLCIKIFLIMVESVPHPWQTHNRVIIWVMPVIPSAYSVGRSCDLLLVNRIWQRCRISLLWFSYVLKVTGFYRYN